MRLGSVKPRILKGEKRLVGTAVSLPSKFEIWNKVRLVNHEGWWAR